MYVGCRERNELNKAISFSAIENVLSSNEKFISCHEVINLHCVDMRKGIGKTRRRYNKIMEETDFLSKYTVEPPKSVPFSRQTLATPKVRAERKKMQVKWNKSKMDPGTDESVTSMCSNRHRCGGTRGIRTRGNRVVSLTLGSSVLDSSIWEKSGHKGSESVLCRSARWNSVVYSIDKRWGNGVQSLQYD